MRNVLLTYFLLTSLSFVAQTPPAQPLLGPGGNTYDHKGVRVTEHAVDSALSYFLIEPVQPQPDSAEVIFFYSPLPFQGDHEDIIREQRLFAEHLVRSGFIIVWPQVAGMPQGTDIEAALLDQKAIMKEAMGIIKRHEDRVRPLYWRDGKIKWGFVGIGGGATYCFDISAHHEQLGLPELDVIAAIVPDTAHYYEGIGPNTKILVISAEDDHVNGPAAAINQHKAVWNGLKDHPCINRAYFTLRSDDHGSPALVADHDLAGSSGSIERENALNALDYYGHWKWTVAAIKCAFRNQDCQYAFGLDNSSIFMGKWTDGQVVRPALRSLDCGEEKEGYGAFVNADIDITTNPASGVFTIRGINDNVKVRVYDPTGAKIHFMRNDNVFHLETHKSGEFVVILEDTTGKGYLHKVMVW